MLTIKSLATFVFGLSTVASAMPALESRAKGAGKAAAVPVGITKAECVTGLHMIVARASTEAAGEGTIGGVSTQVKALIPNSDSEAVDYPATLTDYQNSEGKGVTAMTAQIKAYAARCPNTKIAIMGYSQGAQIVGDIMCGTSSSGFTATPPLDAATQSRIVAMLQMGDPTYVPGQPQNAAGDSKTAGMFPRKDLAACSQIAPRTLSICSDGDTFCASGNSITTHLGYVNAKGKDAAAFVQKMFNAAPAAAAPAPAAPAAAAAGASVSTAGQSAGVGSGSQAAGTKASLGSYPLPAGQ